MKINFRQCCFHTLLAAGFALGGASLSFAQESACSLNYDAEADPQAVGYCISYCEVSNCSALNGTESAEEVESCNAMYDRMVEHTGAAPAC